jgi:hypothetical protein
MPMLIVYVEGKPVRPARVVRRGEDVEELIAEALAAGASLVRVVSRARGREMKVVEAEHAAAPTTG